MIVYHKRIVDNVMRVYLRGMEKACPLGLSACARLIKTFLEVLMLDQEKDTVVFLDDDDNEIELEVLDYFFYNGQEYAVMTEYDDCGEGCECCDECAQAQHPAGDDMDDDDANDNDQDLFIMKVIQLDDGMEEFQPVEDSLMDKLIEIVEKRFSEDYEYDDEDSTQ